MEQNRSDVLSRLFETVGTYMRGFIYRIISVGPIPNHIAFIMDGNRRYAKKNNLEELSGHRAGFSALMSILKYSYELGIKYITVYAFSIDNFKRNPEEVQSLMYLMQEKIEGLIKEESIVNRYGIRVYFIGNLKLLNDPVRIAAEKTMLATSKNTNATLLICLAYTSTDEIVHAVHETCLEKRDEERRSIKVVDIEKCMYMSVAPEPDVLVRSSGETRLSNFLLWQTSKCLLYCPDALWPEIGFWHLVWAVLNFQRHYAYFEKKKKQL